MAGCEPLGPVIWAARRMYRARSYLPDCTEDMEAPRRLTEKTLTNGPEVKALGIGFTPLSSCAAAPCCRAVLPPRRGPIVDVECAFYEG